MNPSAGIIVADRYRLERPLGQGGMGAVWLAYHVGLRIPCAVKFILDKAAEVPVIRARFEREALAAAQIRSPHVVQILDHGIWAGMPYIAMEMLEGEDLEHRLARAGALPPREVLTIVSQVARALTKAHAAGLVHRDLKPANIFLVRDDDQEIAKVLDFGIAKAGEGLAVDSHTKTGAILGTPYYMSPEQAQGSKDVDHRSDLWALGVLTFQCLTGTLPFLADALGELFMRIMVRPLPVPSQVAPVPPGFDGWWLRAVSRDPAGRFQSARELVDALGVALGITAGAMPVASNSVPTMVLAPALGPVPALQATPAPMSAMQATPVPVSAMQATPAPVSAIQVPQTMVLGPTNGMSGSLSAAAASSPGLTVPAKGGATRVITAALVGASFMAAGGIVVWRLSARPVASIEPGPIAAARGSVASIETRPASAAQSAVPAPSVLPASTADADPPVPPVKPSASSATRGRSQALTPTAKPSTTTKPTKAKGVPGGDALGDM